MFIINTFSTCFGHHYAHLQENKTCVTARGVLRWFCWMWLVAVVGRCVVGCEHCEITINIVIISNNHLSHSQYLYQSPLSYSILPIRSPSLAYSSIILHSSAYMTPLERNWTASYVCWLLKALTRVAEPWCISSTRRISSPSPKRIGPPTARLFTSLPPWKPCVTRGTPNVYSSIQRKSFGKQLLCYIGKFSYTIPLRTDH